MKESREQPKDLPHDTVLHRGIRASGWVKWDSEDVDPQAFIRRPGAADNEGLSVVLNPVCAPGIRRQDGCAAELAKCYGELQVEASVVYGLNLGVKVDEVRENKANITDVPLESEDDERAEHIAGQLAKKCKVKARPR